MGHYSEQYEGMRASQLIKTYAGDFDPTQWSEDGLKLIYAEKVKAEKELLKIKGAVKTLLGTANGRF